MGRKKFFLPFCSLAGRKQKFFFLPGAGKTKPGEKGEEMAKIYLNQLRGAGIEYDHVETRDMIVCRRPDPEEARILGVPSGTDPVWAKIPERIRIKKGGVLLDVKPGRNKTFHPGEVYSVEVEWIEPGWGSYVLYLPFVVLDDGGY